MRTTCILYEQIRYGEARGAGGERDSGRMEWAAAAEDRERFVRTIRCVVTNYWYYG
jgi:hypothetical protein